MAIQVTPYAPPLAAAGLAFAVVALWVARRTDRGMQSTWLAVPLFAATAAWTLGYAGELTVTGHATQLLFARIQYLGNATAPVLWFAYVAAYVGYADAIPRWAWGALAAPPLVVLALVWTYPATTLVWTATEQVTVGGAVLLDTDHGPLFHAFMVYVYGLVLTATAMLAERVRSTQGVYRRQALALLAGSVVPAVAGVLYVANVSPLPALNLPALGFVVTGGVVAYSVRHSDLFTLEPVAWETAIAELDDPVFVVDGRERVAAANPAGRAFAGADVGTSAAEALGHVFDEPYWRQPGDHTCEYDDGSARRTLSVSVTPVDRDGATAGHVLVVRDVTERQRREGDATPDAEPVSLAAAARTAWESVEATGADATLDVGEDVTVTADETALVRLLENLFRNATEHAGCDAAVSVGATEGGFYVADDGPGIPAGDRDSVFQSGYTTSEDGTGFGLSIVAEIADSHGWTVDLVDADGGGARFEFGT